MQGSEQLSRAVIAAPAESRAPSAIEAVLDECGDDRQRALADLAQRVTTAPFALTADDRARWAGQGLGDDDVLHAIALSALFGHLNRIADATGVPLDYSVKLPVLPIDPTATSWPEAPAPLTGARALELSMRPATAAALDAWRAYIMTKPSPLAVSDRVRIARWVAGWLGDGERMPGDHDAELEELARLVVLAPWRLGELAYAPLRARGFDDAALFDVCAVASSQAVFSRIDVALMALNR